ncbi:hypothetical protein G3A39_39570 [Paraburkholderia aspalathi]|nr:hypothetical protein [Paraburkholderia aspalathi]
MGLKTILDSLDNVSAELHDLYEEKDGKFVLILDDDVKTHPSVAALSNAYTQEKKRRKDLSDEVAALKLRVEGLPDEFDADAYAQLVAQAEGKEPPKSDDQVVKVRDQLERKHTADLAKRDDTITKLRGTIEKLTVDDGLSRAMDEANIDPKHKKKLAPYLKGLGKIKLEEDDGSFAALVETDMGPVDLNKFVADWAGSDDGREYVGKPKGLDTSGSDGRKADVNPWAKDTRNLTKQGDVVRADPAKARRMMSAAGIPEDVINQRLNG